MTSLSPGDVTDPDDVTNCHYDPGAAPAQDTPVYDEDLTPTLAHPVSLPNLPPIRYTPNVPRIISPQAR